MRIYGFSNVCFMMFRYILREQKRVSKMSFSDRRRSGREQKTISHILFSYVFVNSIFGLLLIFEYVILKIAIHLLNFRTGFDFHSGFAQQCDVTIFPFSKKRYAASQVVFII